MLRRGYNICSLVWLNLRSYFCTILEESQWILGRNSLISLWYYNWHGSPLVERIQNNPTSISVNVVMGDYLQEDGWNLSNSFEALHLEMTSKIKLVVGALVLTYTFGHTMFEGVSLRAKLITHHVWWGKKG